MDPNDNEKGDTIGAKNTWAPKGAVVMEKDLDHRTWMGGIIQIWNFSTTILEKNGPPRLLPDTVRGIQTVKEQLPGHPLNLPASRSAMTFAPVLLWGDTVVDGEFLGIVRVDASQTTIRCNYLRKHAIRLIWSFAFAGHPWTQQVNLS